MRVLAASLAWLAAVAVSAAAQDTASDTLLTVDHYLDWEQVADPPISPDGASLPKPAAGAMWTAEPRLVEDLLYRQERARFRSQGYAHRFRVNADGGTSRPLTSGRCNVGARFGWLVLDAGYDWTPDGRT